MSKQQSYQRNSHIKVTVKYKQHSYESNSPIKATDISEQQSYQSNSHITASHIRASHIKATDISKQQSYQSNSPITASHTTVIVQIFMYVQCLCFIIKTTCTTVISQQQSYLSNTSHIHVCPKFQLILSRALCLFVLKSNAILQLS